MSTNPNPNPVHVPLAETFSESSWARYTTSQAFTNSSSMGRQPASGFPFALSTLNHVDLRTFNAQSPLNPLDHNENWTGNVTASGLTWGSNSNFNNWRMLSWNITSSSTPITLTSISDPVDLTVVGSPTTTFLQAALMNLGLLDLATSYIALSSDGGITWSQIDLQTATASGEFYLSMNSFTNDLSSVNGVRLYLDPIASGSFNWIGLRALGPNYVSADVAFDTWNNILRQDVPFNGETSSYPPPANQKIPFLYYAASTGGTDDPQPIDATFGVVFNTGGNAGTNQFAINMRQVGGTDTTQLVLEGQTQIQLSGPQPNIIQTAEIPRRISDFQGTSVGSLQGMSMLDLDAKAENVVSTYITFKVSWGDNQTITISDSLMLNPYSWSFSKLSSYTNYLAMCRIEENSVQVQIFALDQKTLAVEGLFYDTGLVSDSYQFPRRPGRIGWQTSFTDGETHLVSIRPESTSFAEYQSTPLNSRTPVRGAQVYASYSQPVQFWNSFTAATESPSGGTLLTPSVTADPKRSITGLSTKIYINTPGSGQGVISNVLSVDDYSGITDWSETTIRFSVWVPSSAKVPNSPTLSAYLVSNRGWYIPLNFPSITFDSWSEVAFTGPDIPSGLYRLQIGYLGMGPTTFWIDGVSVSQRLIEWSARANPNDPWISLNDLTGNTQAGARMNPGNQLQVRAQAKRQDAAILSKPKVKPVFASLGKAVWPEDRASFTDSYLTSLNPAFSYTNTGREYTFTATQSAAYIAQWLWQISDGSLLTGPQVSHSFSSLAPSSTVYQVTLTLVDIYGGRATNTETLTVS